MSDEKRFTVEWLAEVLDRASAKQQMRDAACARDGHQWKRPKAADEIIGGATCRICAQCGKVWWSFQSADGLFPDPRPSQES